MRLQVGRDALLKVTNQVSHYKAFKKTDQYIVWAEDSQGDALYGDNRMSEQAIEGTIDYFTRTEYDPNFEKIQEVLSEAEISYRLNSVQYEDETGYIHYECVFQV